MRRQIAIVMYSAVFGLMALSSNAMAQQKTVAACQAEWRANKAANQANGVTEKAYVARCRGGAAPAQTTTAPSAPTATAAQSASGQKTAKACREEWRANKAANQVGGVTESAYVVQCRGGTAPAQTMRLQRHRRLQREPPRNRFADKRLPRRAERNGAQIKLPIKSAA